MNGSARGLALLLLHWESDPPTLGPFEKALLALPVGHPLYVSANGSCIGSGSTSGNDTLEHGHTVLHGGTLMIPRLDNALGDKGFGHNAIFGVEDVFLRSPLDFALRILERIPANVLETGARWQYPLYYGFRRVSRCNPDPTLGKMAALHLSPQPPPTATTYPIMQPGGALALMGWIGPRVQCTSPMRASCDYLLYAMLERAEPDGHGVFLEGICLDGALKATPWRDPAATGNAPPAGADAGANADAGADAGAAPSNAAASTNAPNINRTNMNGTTTADNVLAVRRSLPLVSRDLGFSFSRAVEWFLTDDIDVPGWARTDYAYYVSREISTPEECARLGKYERNVSVDGKILGARDQYRARIKARAEHPHLLLAILRTTPAFQSTRDLCPLIVAYICFR
jgi:hypothetical protein